MIWCFEFKIARQTTTEGSKTKTSQDVFVIILEDTAKPVYDAVTTDVRLIHMYI